MEVHSQSTVSAQMVTPSDGTDSLIEVRIIASRERLHAEEHSAGQPGPQTYPVSSTQIPGESNTCPVGATFWAPRFRSSSANMSSMASGVLANNCSLLPTPQR